jgi:hypothetical protein
VTHFLKLTDPDRWPNLALVADAFYADDGSGDLILVTTAVEAARAIAGFGKGMVTDGWHVRVPAAAAVAVAAELDRLAAIAAGP